MVILKKKYSNIVLLDGDNIRKKLKIDNNITFTNKYRVRIGKKYVKLCKTIIKKKRKYVIIAVMAILREVQNEYKKIENYNDVYLDVPLSELTKRDPKDLYKKFRQKKIKNMVGLDIKFPDEIEELKCSAFKKILVCLILALIKKSKSGYPPIFFNDWIWNVESRGLYSLA